MQHKTTCNTCADLIWKKILLLLVGGEWGIRFQRVLKLLKKLPTLPETCEREGTRRVALAARCILKPPSAETESFHTLMESPHSWSEKAISQLNHQVEDHLHFQNNNDGLGCGATYQEDTHKMHFLPPASRVKPKECFPRCQYWSESLQQR